ncbi:o-acyltransferase [Anaeramoeba ignava]|uniref:O-acyltransferase n=1 Tax=Anaeramoeba ignava TaxID=1746090 RepID=A0A9Q0R8W7_ANAIG|nr:o-acyltransferase [Anaeramoeba ignava]
MTKTQNTSQCINDLQSLYITHTYPKWDEILKTWGTNINDLGKYESCLEINKNQIVKLTRYCVLKTKFRDVDVSLGACLPFNCTESELNYFVPKIRSFLPIPENYPISVSCSIEYRKSISFLLIVLFFVFVGMTVVIGTFLHSRILKREEQENPNSNKHPKNLKPNSEKVEKSNDPEKQSLKDNDVLAKNEEMETQEKTSAEFMQLDSSLPMRNLIDNEETNPFEPNIQQEIQSSEEENQHNGLTQSKQGNQEKKKKSGTAKNNWKVEFFLQFSLLKNIPRIATESHNSFKVLHSLRVLSMLWIILGHTYSYFIATAAVGNILGAESLLKRFSFQFVVGAEFGVDLFFVLSGMLAVHSLLAQLKSTNGKVSLVKFYFHRYWRIAPLFLIVIWIGWKFAIQLGNGPMWKLYQESVNKPCSKSWWANAFLITDFYPKWENSCFGHLWYLSLDFQFYLLSPAIIFLFYRNRKFGYFSVFSLMILSFIITASVVSGYNISQSVAAPNSSDYWNKVYVKPWCRITPFLLGMILGFVLYERPENSSRKVRKKLRISLFLFAGFLMTITTFGTYSLYHSDDLNGWNKSENIWFITFSRFAFSLGLLILLYLFLAGYGGSILVFLSSDFWVPFSRATYATYLIHPIIMRTIEADFKASFYWSDSIIAVYFCGFSVLGFAAGFLLSLCFESPLMNFEKIFWEKVGRSLKEQNKNNKE